VRFGAVFPQTEIERDPGAIRAWTQAADELGFDHVLVIDHVLGADTTSRPGWSGPYTADSMFHEVLVLLGYIAAVAPRLELVTSVVVAPQRQTALLAKQAAQVDVLTEGKFRLGVGVGWNDVEYEALGETFDNRGRRLEEQIEVLRLLWREPVVTYRGRWHTITAAGLNPLPQRREVPIWIGAHVDVGVKRAARLADGIFPVRPEAADAPGYVERLRGWLDEAGRDPAQFGIEPWVRLVGDDPDPWQARAKPWVDAGATHLALSTVRDGLRGAAAHIARLERAAEGFL
jgi:probable F420-dependent oxidoreductase